MVLTNPGQMLVHIVEWNWFSLSVIGNKTTQTTEISHFASGKKRLNILESSCTSYMDF